ncbi:unnamed protein product [Leptidea sinapis]|uniref:Uncharacterized protein n=1 Tax=Leptidea sinapis TaxID=189913 RepID=A0A5E4QKM3_9NEOP|nr:unnamed protein product [Leptidea sinapis]
MEFIMSQSFWKSIPAASKFSWSWPERMRARPSRISVSWWKLTARPARLRSRPPGTTTSPRSPTTRGAPGSCHCCWAWRLPSCTVSCSCSRDLGRQLRINRGEHVSKV